MCGYMHMAHHDCRAWISILCWFWINPYLLKKYLAVSLCALGQQAITIIWFLKFLISFFTLKIWFSSFSKVNFTFIFFSSSVFFHKSQYNKNHKILVLKFNGYSIDEINIKCLILIGKKKHWKISPTTCVDFFTDWHCWIESEKNYLRNYNLDYQSVGK